MNRVIPAWMILSVEMGKKDIEAPVRLVPESYGKTNKK